MKSILNILVILTSISVWGQGIKFEENPTFSTILEKAKKEKKLIFVDAYASWCGPCKMMTKDIFPQKEVGDFYNKNFINLAMDMEKGEGRTLAQKYSVTSYPTYLFINGNGELVHKDLGYMDNAKFIELGNASLNILKFGNLKDRFEKGEKNPEFLEKVIKQYHQSDYPLAKAASEKYFELKKTPIILEELSLLLPFIKSTQDKNYLYLKSNFKEITQLVPEENINNFLNPIFLNEIIYKTLGQKEIDEEKFLSQTIPLVGEIRAKEILNYLLLDHYLAFKNYDKYEKVALELFKDPDLELISVHELAKAAKVFAEHIQNPESLKIAQVWAEKTVMVDESAENTYTLAKLLYKNGKKEMARDYAKLSKIIAENTNQNTQYIDALIQEMK